MKIPSNSELNEIKMPYHPVIEENLYFNDHAGREYYRLLSYISNQFKYSTFIDVGTYRGLSAFALATDKSNFVISYDIEDRRELDADNIHFVIGDVLKEKQLRSASVILLDTLHDGVFENKFINHLRKIEYSGILLLDDIHLNKEMEMVWDSITETKKDLTNIGHYTGTGYVEM